MKKKFKTKGMGKPCETMEICKGCKFNKVLDDAPFVDLCPYINYGKECKLNNLESYDSGADFSSWMEDSSRTTAAGPSVADPADLGIVPHRKNQKTISGSGFISISFAWTFFTIRVFKVVQFALRKEPIFANE